MDNSPRLRDLARRALELEAAGSRDPIALVQALERLWARLCHRLARLMGYGGFRAIAARALREARAEFPFLAGVELGPQNDASPVGLQDEVRGRDPEMVADGCAALLAGILAMLLQLLGSDITSRTVKDAWPGVGCNQDYSLSGK